MTTPWEEGSPDSKLLVLAEAPSHVEIRMGRPLVGPSGEVFNDCLHTAGIARRECYILNVWPYKVAKDTKGNIFNPSGSSDPLWSATRGMTEYGWFEAEATLERIVKSKANCILTLGQQALGLTIDKRPIMKWRGSILPGFNGRKFIPTIHPAATLHGTYLWRYLIINDMAKAKRHSAFPEVPEPWGPVHIWPEFDDVMSYFERCYEAGKVATDIEVINHQVNCFSLATSADEAMTVPLAHENGQHYWAPHQEAEIWRAYARLMSDPEVTKINQNLVGFDAVFLFQKNNIRTRGFLADTMIAQHILYPDFPKGLDFITSIHTEKPYYKDEGKMWRTAEGGMEQFWTYCGRDAIVAFEAWQALEQELTEGGYWPTYNRTVRMADPLTYMSTRGFYVDREALAETKTSVERRLAEKEAELEAVAEWPFKPSSPKQCQKYFYETKGITPYKSRTGGITTDDKAMARIVRRYHLPEAKLVQEIRALQKLKGTYLEVAFDADNRLRCSWNPRGTTTGRLSSSQTIFGTGMNLQNLAPGFKGFIQADKEPLDV